MSTNRTWFREEVVVGTVLWEAEGSVDLNERTWTFKAVGPSGRFAQGKFRIRDIRDRMDLAAHSLQRVTQMSWTEPSTGEAYTFDLRPTPPARVTVIRGEEAIGMIELPPGRLLTGLTDQELTGILTRAKNTHATRLHREEERKRNNDNNH